MGFSDLGATEAEAIAELDFGLALMVKFSILVTACPADMDYHLSYPVRVWPRVDRAWEGELQSTKGYAHSVLALFANNPFLSIYHRTAFHSCLYLSNSTYTYTHIFSLFQQFPRPLNIYATPMTYYTTAACAKYHI